MKRADRWGNATIAGLWHSPHFRKPRARVSAHRQTLPSRLPGARARLGEKSRSAGWRAKRAMLTVKRLLGFAGRSSATGAAAATGTASKAPTDSAARGARAACAAALVGMPLPRAGPPTSVRRAGPSAHGPGARASGEVVELWLDHETETKEAVVELRAEQVAHRTRLSPLKFAAPAYAELNTAIAVPTATTLKLLTPEQLARKRSSEFLLLHGNDGLWATGAAALHAINHWASDHTKCGGSWGVI